MHADKIPQNKSRAGDTIAAQQSAGKAAVQLQDNRPKAVTQHRQVQAPANFAVNDLPIQKKENQTGLPDQLKSGIENLSGIDVSDVKVHYNSDKPAQLNAHAYAQGTDIHLASGQEKYLPHEAWHVVQQKQRRVKPTLQMKGKVNVNDDKGLENEADVMGAKALQLRFNPLVMPESVVQGKASNGVSHGKQTAQRFALNPVIVGGIRLSTSEQAKWNQVVLDFTAFGIAEGNPFMVELNLEHRGGTNPADTRVINNNGVEDIEVNIADWFVNMSTVGEILALLVHEVGVHSLADRRMTPAEVLNETNNNPNAVNVQAGPHLLTMEGNPGVGADTRQPDHVNVVKDAGALLNANPRAREYAWTMLSVGDAIEASARPAPQKIVAQRQLVDTFLFDVARIMATDDGGGRQQYRASNVVADVMNWYKVVITARHAVAHAWLQHLAVDPLKTGNGIRSMLKGKIGSFLTSRIKTSKVGRGAVKVARGIGRGVAGAARGVYNAGGRAMRAVRNLFR